MPKYATCQRCGHAAFASGDYYLCAECGHRGTISPPRGEWTPYTPAPMKIEQIAPARVEWEYKIVDIEDHFGDEAMIRRMNDASRGGWEAFHLLHFPGERFNLRAVLKRPIPPGPATA